MTEIEQLKNEVRRCIRKHGYIKVAAAAGLGSKNTLRNADSAAWNPTSDTLTKVLDVIRKGLLDGEAPDHAA